MDIKVTIEDLTQVKKRMQVEVPAGVALQEFDRVARNLLKRVRLPGFRPGKAPLGLVKQHYHSDIREEVLNDLVPRSYEQAVKSHSLRPLGQPRLEHLDYHSGEPLKYTAEFEIEPEFTLPSYKGLKLEVRRRPVEEEDVERELGELRERNAVLEPAEERPIQEGDYAAIRLEGDYLWDGEPPRNPPAPIRDDNVMVEVGAENTHQAFSEALMGMKAGEEKEVKVSYPEDYQDKTLAGRRLKFHITVNDVKQKALPEPNDEFARIVGDYEDIGALRKKIREELEEAADQQLRMKRESDLLDKLIEPLHFEVPDVLVEDRIDDRVRRFVRSIATRGVDPMKAEVDWVKFRRDARPAAVKEVMVDLVLERIAEEERIEVAKEEVEEELAALAKSSDQPLASIRQWMSRENRMEELVDRLRKQKTVEFLLQSATS